MTLILHRLPVPARLVDRGIDDLLVYRVPLTVRFRRIDVRDGLLLHGPAGWGETSPFWDYDAAESSAWLRAGLEGATSSLPDPLRDRIPVNATVPVVDPGQAHRIVASSGCATAKVKVADPRSRLSADCARLEAVRDALGPDGRIRIDANAAWTVDEAVAAIGELRRAAGELEYAEQPCPSVADLAAVRRRVDVPIAADESVRRAEDPLAVARAGAADLIIVKAQPLGGVRRALRVVEEAGLPAIVSSALDTGVGIGLAAHLAAALPRLDHACGLATTRLFTGDVTEASITPENGSIPVRRAEVDTSGVQTGDEELCARWAARLAEMMEALDA
ncbi:o-succinylbenzoate synthase [Acidipropionibacterium virtanenii]|uniref:o-succinylbenzoate synthase n=1 Tax=Acidipropionibacterium virtanenii TaxID=2057246 RepID=A0A344UV01_9ACTN|nr:o-succinylbenzoate synthase [Acidipropionibacterium virtanenii]AXE39099.1 o-succinylbenzoate synthase [Acidipropionibacterium virtanenii]